MFISIMGGIVILCAIGYMIIQGKYDIWAGNTIIWILIYFMEYYSKIKRYLRIGKNK